MFALRKNGMYLLVHGMYSGRVTEADLFKWHEAFVTASQNAMKENAEIVSAMDVMNEMLSNMDNEAKMKIKDLEREVADLKNNINSLTRVNTDLLSEMANKSKLIKKP